MKKKRFANPLVSVIVPNYCHAKYLEQRLESIVNQTYRNFEIIILDDCSPDGGASRTVIERYRDNPHVSHIVYNEVNSGSTFKQWALGLKLAKGELCWIAESDDFCEVTLLEHLVPAFEQNDDLVIAYAPVVYVDESGQQFACYSKEGREQIVKSRDFIVKYLCPDNCIQNASCALFLRQAALSIDPDFVNHGGISDWWFWFEIAELGKIAIVNKHLSYFRRHENTVTLNSIKDGTNLVHEKEYLEFVCRKYQIPGWRMRYLYHYHANSKRDLPFNNAEIRARMARLWDFDHRYCFIDRVLHRLLNELRQRFLIRL